METETVVSSISLGVSLFLAAVYVWDRRHAKFSVENEYTNGLLAWHREAVELLMQARHCEKERESDEHCADLASLSAIIEQGRFFFPNIILDNFGEGKPPAYRGYRNLALDFLVASYNLLHEKPSEESRSRLEELQRHFTSIVFEVVRPKERLEKIRRLTDRYFTKDYSSEDFSMHWDSSIIESVWHKPRRRHGRG